MTRKTRSSSFDPLLGQAGQKSFLEIQRLPSSIQKFIRIRSRIRTWLSFYLVTAPFPPPFLYPQRQIRSNQSTQVTGTRCCESFGKYFGVLQAGLVKVRGCFRYAMYVMVWNGKGSWPVWVVKGVYVAFVLFLFVLGRKD